MAETRPRRAGPLWVWVLGLILVVLLIWFTFDLIAGRDIEQAPPDELGMLLGADGAAHLAATAPIHPVLEAV